MKKHLLGLLCLFLLFIMAGCEKNTPNDNGDLPGNNTPEEVETMKIKISVNGYDLSATLEQNEAAKAFYELAKTGLTLKLAEYGGFEKVGPIGKTLPSSDKQINTKTGDLILYASNQLSLMYGTNSWSYTRLGTIDNLEEINLSTILGSGDVTVTFSV